FYSLGVWAERISRYLKLWHVIAFWTGFIFDMSGTWAMHLIAKQPFDLTNPHTLTGQIALWLMLAHALWATIVVKRGNEKELINFNKYSVIVWLFWLVPYFSGLYIGMKF
ncbi:MAG: TIGR03987 family protein, partial [Calditrichia bacterium]|nr:TIGR03987 family protein [Calditrichia bacterium]